MFAPYSPAKYCTMSADDKTPITVTTTINAPVEKVWERWSQPEHVVNWNHASADWHTTRAENDLRAGGRFVMRMEAKDGSFGFDFGGVNEEIRTNEYQRYKLDDGRKVEIHFEEADGHCTVTETFEPEGMNPRELQQTGWQAILDNFKKYAEGS